MDNVDGRLALDLDEVTFDYLGGLRNFCRSKGKAIPDESPISWDLTASGWFVSTKEFLRYHHWAVEEGLYANLKVMPGVFDALWSLSDSGMTIDIVTSRFVIPGQHEKVVAQTAFALEKNRIPFKNICFLKNKTLYKADLNIDDGPHNIRELEEADMAVITMATSYNKDCGSVRAENWEEAETLIRDFFRIS